MPLTAFPPQLIRYPLNNRVSLEFLCRCSTGLCSELLIVSLNMEFSEPEKWKIWWLMRTSHVVLTLPHPCVLHFISWHFSLNSCWFIHRGERCNVLLWLPFHFAWSKWVNYEMEAGFWTQASWRGPEKGPIWEQSPTDISAVQICYRNEYHCCLGGPAPKLKWWMTASRKISPPDVRFLQFDWTSVKINMKEKCCLTTQTWLPSDLLVLITGWCFRSAKTIFPLKMERVEIVCGAFFQVVIRDAHEAHGVCLQRGIVETWYDLVKAYTKTVFHTENMKNVKVTNYHYNLHLMYETEVKSGAQIIHSVFSPQSAKLKTLKKVSIKFQTNRYLKRQNVIYNRFYYSLWSSVQDFS